MHLYKIVSPDQWDESQQTGHVVPGSADTTFIHLSTEDQLPRILAKFWANTDHIVLKLDPTLLEGNLRFETNPGGTNNYYHLYAGRIPVGAVVSQN